MPTGYITTTTTYSGHVLCTGAAELDDKARLDNADPKADYLVGARVQGIGIWLCANDPTTAANWGYTCPSSDGPDPAASPP